MQVFFNSLFGANYLNGIMWWSDPDVVMVREPLTMDEGCTIVSSIALTGQTYLINDFIAELSEERVQRIRTQTGWGRQYPNLIKKLPEERLELYRKTMPTMPITAMDLYPFKTEPIVRRGLFDYPKALNLKVNAASGVYDVVAVYNWSDETSIKTVSFGDDLGLDTEKKYLVFDFWNRKLEGIFNDKIQVDVPTHGTRVFVIRLLSDRPQLLATSRHISGAFSIKELAWHSSESTLSGVSQTIPDVPYSLYFYVPEGVTLTEVDASAKVLFHKITDGLLEAAFQGQETPLSWSLHFGRKE